MIHLLFRLLAALPEGARRRTVRVFMDIVWRLYTREEIRGREHVPSGPCLFISNHLSNADGYTLVRALRPKRVRFLAGVKLRETTMTRLGLEVVETIPIRPNSADLEAIKRAVEMLRAGQSVVIFPEGGRSRKGALIRAKKGVALIARRAGVPVLPVALTGTERFLPIDDTNMGGERAHFGVPITVTFGPPFRPDSLMVDPTAEDDRQALADAMMRKVAALLPEKYRGVYGERQDPED